jgi:hypothetical protein
LRGLSDASSTIQYFTPLDREADNPLKSTLSGLVEKVEEDTAVDPVPIFAFGELLPESEYIEAYIKNVGLLVLCALIRSPHNV